MFYPVQPRLTPLFTEKNKIMFCSGRSVIFFGLVWNVATSHRPQNPKWLPGVPKMDDVVLEWVHSRLLGTTKNFHWIGFLSKGSFYEKPRTTCKIKNCRQGDPKWQTWSGKGSNPRLLVAPKTFPKLIGILIQALLLCKIQNCRQG